MFYQMFNPYMYHQDCISSLLKKIKKYPNLVICPTTAPRGSTVSYCILLLSGSVDNVLRLGTGLLKT